MQFRGGVQRHTLAPRALEHGPVLQRDGHLELGRLGPHLLSVSDVVAVVGAEQPRRRCVHRLVTEADGEDRVLRRIVDAQVHMVRRREDEERLALVRAEVVTCPVRVGEQIGRAHV
mgnify:CR=1 FL=1